MGTALPALFCFRHVLAAKVGGWIVLGTGRLLKGVPSDLRGQSPNQTRFRSVALSRSSLIGRGLPGPI
jgi:hypothetical protein